MTTGLHRIVLGLVAGLLCCGVARAQGWRHVGDVASVARLPDGVELSSGPARVRVTVHGDGVFRVRMAPDGRFASLPSWAVVAPPQATAVAIREDERHVLLQADGVRVSIRKSPLLVEFHDTAGNVLFADAPELPMASNGTRVRTWKRMPADEHYYGLGDKAGPLDRRGRSFSHWNTDAFGWQGTTDPLYKTIPFFIGLRKGRAYGVFLDNTWWSSFDFGKESDALLSFGAEGGELDYYFIAGPGPARVIERYTALTGRTPLPPLWALGFQQSRFTYTPEARVREVARLLRAKKIPADTLYLDIDYQQGNAPFTVNRALFPTFERMIADLRADGFRTVLITDLHIKQDPGKGYAPYDSGIAGDMFVRYPDGSRYVGQVWPGASVFPDFTLARVRAWWGGLYRDFAAMGAAGYWNDMNEPSVFATPSKTMPLDVVHRLDDGSTLDHRAIHNVYGMQNARATYEGLLKLQPGQRPFVLTRAAYAGTQRYAATWTGDNSATWHHLAQSTPNLLNLGLSGYALAGDDIGGFTGSPPADLATRWYQLGAFNPVFRSHAAVGTRDHEPWADGPEHEAIRKRYIELRYRLLPYLYTLAEETSRNGMPLMRPLFLHYAQAEAFYGNDRDFLLGPDLLVAPVVSETRDAHVVTLPPGEWYDYWTGSRVAGKDNRIESHPRLQDVPLYVRAGAIVPMQPLVQHTGETPRGPLELHAWLPSPASREPCRGALYQDDGGTFAYREGNYLRMAYACEVSTEEVSLRGRIEHAGFTPWWRSVRLTVHGVEAEPRALHVGTRRVEGWRHDRADRSVVLVLPDGLVDWQVRLSLR